MGKNPLNSFKSAVNIAGDSVSETYQFVSKDVSKTASEILPLIVSETNKKSKLENKKNNIKKQNGEKMNPLEKQIYSQYIGCFLDDPFNPSMENYLGEVSNSLECINLGKKNNFKYVGIQQGDKCFASDILPNTEEVDKKTNCNVGCDDINTGNCGGFFYNQVYKTDNVINLNNLQIENNKKNKINNKLKTNNENETNIENNINSNNLNNQNINTEINNENNVNNILENFITSDIEMEKINYGLSHVNCNCWYPVNSYVLFLWILILLILLYLLFEYIYKKSS